MHTIQYDSKTSEIYITYRDNLQKLGLDLVGGQIVYKVKDYTTISKNFDNNTNYYKKNSITIITDFL